MKKTLKLTVALLGFAMIFGTSCKKYEEGPGISLRSKKARLVNTWVADKAEDKDGNAITISAAEKEFTTTYEKDGKFFVADGDGDKIIEGTWEFGDKKESLKTSFDFFGQSQTSENDIILLKNKEMGFVNEDGDKYYYVAK